ncbi:hypothetical protein C0995_004172 [Termitomyces sp. Mi166|nr:hypothetical protein C0995_004172 [Termitomyces sp. Mi166\
MTDKENAPSIDLIEEATYNPKLDKVWWKVDVFALPVVAMFYLLSFLDRTNLGNARVTGLQTDLKMNNYEYCIALTVTYIPYIVAELPSNLVLKAVGPNLLLPNLMESHNHSTSVPPFAVAFVVSIIVSYLSDRYGAHGIVSIFSGVLATIGFAMFYTSSSPNVKYGSLFMSITATYNGALHLEHRTTPHPTPTRHC